MYRARTLHARSDVTKADLVFAGAYRVGDVVTFAARSKSIGVQKGDAASVLAVDRDRNLVVAMLERDGRTIQYDPRRAGTGASIYEPQYQEFSAGDRIQFTRSLPKENISNRALGTLLSIDQSGNASIKLDTGAIWRGNLERMPHVSQGYVMTSFSSQAASVERFIVHLDTDAPGALRLLTQQLAYVAISRGRKDVQVFTNTHEDLAQTLLRSEEKATALAPQEISSYRRANEVRNSVGVGMGM